MQKIEMLLPVYREAIKAKPNQTNMSSTKNTKQNRKVVRAEYERPQSIFEIPDDLDLEDKSIVESWGVKWNTLRIKYVGVEGVVEIEPTRDACESEGDFKYPSFAAIDDAENVCYEYEDDEDEDEDEEGSKCGECGVSTQGRKIRSLWNNTLCEKCGEESDDEEDEDEDEDGEDL